MPHVCTILGGPNGSGKSSVFNALQLPGRFINADLVARRLNPENPEDASRAAGEEVLGALAELLRNRQDFVYETTLSSNQSIRFMQQAVDAGYEVGLIFIVLRDVELNIGRVAQRVAEGGHDIAEGIIRRRYATAFRRLEQAIRTAHGTIIYDNTEISDLEVLVQIRGRSIEVNNLNRAEPLHVQLAAIVGKALDMIPDHVFLAAKGAQA